MIGWLGISHLFELSQTEAIAGFFSPQAIFAVFFMVQLILPGRRDTGFVVGRETVELRSYRLNGILVFAIAVAVCNSELVAPREWFYRSSIYAVAGGTFTCLVISILAVYSQPRREHAEVHLQAVAGPEVHGGSSSLSTSSRATARYCAAACGISPGTSTTWG